MVNLFVKAFIISVLLFSWNNVSCQRVDSCHTNDFSNRFLQEGRTGKAIITMARDSTHIVIVRWSNGYIGVGSILNNKAFGKWYLYDKRNRLRETILFGYSAECILRREKFDRKGNTISLYSAMTPCF